MQTRWEHGLLRERLLRATSKGGNRHMRGPEALSRSMWISSSYPGSFKLLLDDNTGYSCSFVRMSRFQLLDLATSISPYLVNAAQLDFHSCISFSRLLSSW
ncbi:hypothetical protein I7I53_02394 [Histoplasma capsulatum var. duboisii H88]|uniref:Uncharacterized protein n=1 Tax=Ajellomyces capsulatus (strain H88) TaxID=544711 RepID=A0A8A1LQ76_AJEC8|nr:hypothetical protein I7I53_02394 [Histoplasma capsulatum var. duboisii H88]